MSVNASSPTSNLPVRSSSQYSLPYLPYRLTSGLLHPSPSTMNPFATPKPTDLLPTSTSLLYANLHPILLLSILAFTFPAVVADPVPALLGLAPTTALLQGLYCVLCLPSTGQSPPEEKRKGGEKRKAGKAAGSQDVWAKVVVRSFPPYHANMPSTPSTGNPQRNTVHELTATTTSPPSSPSSSPSSSQPPS